MANVLKETRSKMKLLIIHLSDTHLHSERNSVITKFPFVAKALQNEEVELAGVVVVVSGDIAFSGRTEEYKVAADCLSQLKNELSTKTKANDVRFVFVPGNHDCEFPRAGSARETIINALRKGINAPVDDGMVDLCCDVQRSFFTFRDAFPTGSPNRPVGPIYWEYIWNKGEINVLFRCYNTAWLSQLSEQQGSLFFPEKYLRSALSAAPADYCVAVFHHPYNWLSAATHREFRGHIEKISDLVLTGHEHEPDHYQKYTFRGEANEYLEGAVFQEKDQPERSGFHVICVDLASQRQRVVSFFWQDGMYVPTELGSGWAPYKRAGRGGKRDFDLSDQFSKWVDDPGAAFAHPAKADLTLSDIFVFPNLKEFQIRAKHEFVYGSLVEGRDVLKALSPKRRVLIFGRQQAGKTTLAKVLFRDFYNKGITPVLLSGDDLSREHVELAKFEELVEQSFQNQYRNPLLPKFQQLDREKTLIIIDDYDQARLNAKGRLKLLHNVCSRYDRVFIFGDDVLQMEEIASAKASGEVLADFDQFEIMQFGCLLRNKLIEQWYSLGSEYVANPEELAKKTHQAETLITALIGKNYLPSYPIFVLTLIQARDSGTPPDTSVGTYGGLYEVLITQALAKKSKAGNLDLKMAYLSELAYWMFSNQKKRITEDDWMRFHGEYCAKFKIKPSREELKREFEESGLFEQIDTRYDFRHHYSYYYFVARYLRDNITQPEVRSIITSLCEKLYKDEHASIWLFLSHLTKDPFIVDVILTHARSTFSKLRPAAFDEDVKFLATLSKSVEQIVLVDKDFGEIKEARLRRLDSAPTAPEEADDSEAETNEALKFISQINLALRTLEVLGQIVKNFPGSLIGTHKFALVKECYELGLRTTSMLLGFFKDNADGIIEFLANHVQEKFPKIHKRDELENKIRSFLFWMIEGTCFGLVKRVSTAVGHSQLGETYAEVLQSMKTNAVALIDVSIQLDNLGMPEDLIEDLSKRFGNNVFCDRLLRQLVVHHFYMFPTKEHTKQKVCAALKIPIRNLRGIDQLSKDEKVVTKAI